MRRIAGPSITRAFGVAAMRNCSSASAPTIRCTVERGNCTRLAICPRLRPSSSFSSARKIAAARAMTFIPWRWTGFLVSVFMPVDLFLRRSSLLLSMNCIAIWYNNSARLTLTRWLSCWHNGRFSTLLQSDAVSTNLRLYRIMAYYVSYYGTYWRNDVVSWRIKRIRNHR